MQRSRRHLSVLLVLTVTALFTLSARADLQNRQGQDRDDDDPGSAQLPTGQFVTPTALDDAVQQWLNPGLAAYPNFVAGEAVRSQLSPDGTTLAILTAGQNSLVKPDGNTDMANSTQ